MGFESKDYSDTAIHTLLRTVFLGCAVTTLMLASVTAGFSQSAGIGGDGKTFAQRKQEWLNTVPPPMSQMSMVERRKFLFAWLESGVYNDVVSETIRDFIGDYWLKSIYSQHAFAAMIAFRYGSKGSRLISDADEQAIRKKYETFITNSSTFGNLNANKQIAGMVGTYLYTSYFDNSLEFPIYGYSVFADPNSIPSFVRSSWPSFSYNGHSYTFGGGPYNAKQLAEDWLKWVMDGWFVGKIAPRGNREFDSVTYTRAFAVMTALLADMAPDPEMRRRARMAADLVNLDSVMDYSANGWGGTIGRTDFVLNRRAPIYPFHEYWGIGDVVDNGVDKWMISVCYFLNYVPPDVIIDAGVLSDEPDDYWHFHKEYNERLLNGVGKGKWDFATKFYSLGSNVGAGNHGWQLTVKGPGRESFIHLWVNDQAAAPPETQETSYLGTKGRQFRNALFADVGATPHLWQQKSGVDWDREESESGWLFKKLGRTMVAVKLGNVSAAMEVAVERVDYSDWGTFKQAIIENARLTSTSYRTSEGTVISNGDFCGLDNPGDCRFPFDRIETIDNRGNKIVDWNNNVMTVTKHGRSLRYDFNNWTMTGETGDLDFDAPGAPAGVQVQTGNE